MSNIQNIGPYSKTKLTILATTLASLSTLTMAQIIVDNETIHRPAGTSIDTGTTTGTAGRALSVENNGHFIADGDISLITGGSLAHAAFVSGEGSSASLLNGSILTTSGNNSYGAYIQNNGHLSLDKAHITTSGNSAYGVATNTGGQIEMVDTVITTTSKNSNGINSNGQNSHIAVNGSTIITSGDRAHGINTVSGSKTTLKGNHNTITTTGVGAYGLNVTGIDSQLITDGSVQITTHADKAIGVNAAASGTINLGDNTVVKTSTNNSDTNAYGLYANGANGLSSITASNLTVETGSKTGHGIYAANAGGIVTINGQNNHITTTGSGATGIIASKNDSEVVITGKVTVTTTGEKSNGATATNDGGLGTTLVDLGTGSIITTTNDNAKGLVSNHAGATLKATDALVDTAGMASHGAYALDQATIELTGGEIIARGIDSHAVYATDVGTTVTLNETSILATGIDAHAIRSDTGAKTIITQKNRILSSTQGTTLYAKGGMIDATIDGSQVQNNGKLIDAKTDSDSGLLSQIKLTAQNLSMSGDIQAESSSTASLSLRHANWHGKATNATDFELDRSSVWHMSASSDVLNLSHAGQITVTKPENGNFNTLTVRNNYIGEDGTISLNTKLDGDGSASDQLRVAGDTSGKTKLHITNVGGTGALTVANGIQVVDVKGKSNGSFKLANRVTSGLYEYDLFQNGITDKDADGNWYLRSMMLSDGKPVISTESTVYLRNLGVASSMFMHTLHDRLGEPQFTNTYKADNQKPSALWVRVVGNHTKSTGGNGQVDLDTDTSLVHIGGDIVRFTNGDDDRLHIGLMGAYGHSKTEATANQMATNYSGVSRSATGKIDGYSVGAYATWYENKNIPEGLYIDSWAQYNRYANKVKGNTLKEESYDSKGWTASIEAGYAFIAQDKDDRQLMIEPQIQVAYSHYKADDHTDQNGTFISNSNTNGFTSRVGARIYSRSKLSDNGLQPFAEANWWYSNIRNKLNFNQERMDDSTPKSRYELKVGLQGELTQNWLMWGHLGGQVGENSYRRYEGMIGIKRML